MSLKVEKIIRDYLPTVIHMSLATVKENKPWICEVHFAFDEDLNLYFRSLADRRHSLEIKDNPRVAGNIVRQHQLRDRPLGVYFEGQAELLADVNDQHPAFLSYSQRFNTGNSILEELSGPNPHQFYKVSVETFYIFDGVTSSPSQKYALPWKKI